MRMGDGVRADLDPPLREPAKLLPVHRRHLLGIGQGLLGQLGDVERPAVLGIAGAGEHGRRDAQPLEDGQTHVDVLVRVVERHVERPRAAGESLVGADSPVAAAKEAREVLLQQAAGDCELVRPRVRHGVVTEDERAKPGAHGAHRGRRAEASTSRYRVRDAVEIPSTGCWSSCIET